jgi:ubiquinone/menaquinone biosynthesis C-methylase UbiE
MGDGDSAMTPTQENNRFGALLGSRQREPTLTSAVRLHDQLAGDWEARYQKRSFAQRLELLDEFLSGLDLRSMLWLDAGCGTGTMSRWLAARGCQVRGVDAAPAMIQNAYRVSSQSAVAMNLRFEIVENIEKLPFPGDTFDGVLCSSVLEYTDRPERCLAEFARVVRSGGKLLISVPNAQSLVRRTLRGVHALSRLTGGAWLSYLDHSRHQYSSAEFTQHLRTQGFGVERAIPFGTTLPRWMQRLGVVGPLIMVLATKS